jgi:hypothetical protein
VFVRGVSREVVPVRVWAMVEVLGTGVRGESVQTGVTAEDMWDGVNSGGQWLNSETVVVSFTGVLWILSCETNASLPSADTGLARE